MFKKSYRGDEAQIQFRMPNIYNDTAKYRRKPQRDTDQPIPHSASILNKSQQLAVYEPEEYMKLQTVLTKKLEMIMQNLQISREKNRLKDKEIQIIAQSIDKIIEKISSLETKISMKQKKLNSISLKCHNKTSLISKDQQKIKKQSILLLEQTSKCESLQADIKILQQKYNSAKKELQHCKKINQSLDGLQSQNEELHQQLSQLKNQEKMIDYMQNNEKMECEQLENKLEELKAVHKERSKINKRNMAKLNQLKKQISGLQDSQSIISKKAEEIKKWELELGELNQQLLLFNQDIAQFDFKIRKKEKNISELKQKLAGQSINTNMFQREKHRVIESEDEPSRTENHSQKTSKKNSGKKNQQLLINSKNVSPMRNRSNLTPTFPSNELKFQGSNQMASMEQIPNEAFKNIEKLINRFQQIKNKEKSKNT